MFASLSRGWSLTKTSFKVLSLDKEILWLPLFAGVALLAIWAIGIGGIATGILQSWGLLGWLLVAALYVLSYAVGIFFQAATIEMAMIRFNGGNPTLRDGLRKAWSRAGRILQWALVAATVGLLLQMMRDSARDNMIARLIVNFLDIGWSVATFFVVPSLVFQDVGPLDAIRSSLTTVKRTFGEGTVGIVTTTFIFIALAIPGVLLLFLALNAVSAGVLLVLTTIAVVYLVGVFAVASAVRGILLAGLYKYAVDGALPQAFADTGVHAENLAW